MNDVTELLQQAKQRAETMGLPYAGALTPQEAHQLKQLMPAAILLDVRSAAEWQFVGTIPYALRLEWRSFPGMVASTTFLSQLSQVVDKQACLMVLCRTGARSDEVARLACTAGYAQVFNVLNGFEGERDSHGRRGQLNGWKAAQLPWEQT
ncbi:rhodanese-like domain-containing protein [Neisseriaceae bacterium TC5R-5]|nr:rhodanese-like domain-containing protein [Neisseriaceae bacterium TC5R-5]